MKPRALLIASCVAFVAFAGPNRIALAQDGNAAIALTLVEPSAGTHFEFGWTIQLRASLTETGGTWRVEFFDGDQRIGETVPDRPFWWDDACGGQHVITARATNTNGMTLISASATISVAPDPVLPWARVYAVPFPGRTVEPCVGCPTVTLDVGRSCPTNEPLTIFLQVDGTATPGQDYLPLPTRVDLAAGQRSVKIPVEILDDALVEGTDVIRVRILPPPPDAPPTYQVSPREAFIYIRDNDPGAPQVRLDIISPTNGEHLALGPVVELSAIATYDFGEVEFVDFYSDEAWIGWSVVFQGERPPINGLPSVHAIRWTNPPVGPHVLTARTQVSFSLWATSPPIQIVVGPENCVEVTISDQPRSQSVLENCPVTFSVGVIGTRPYSYQWFRDEQPVADATNGSFTIPRVSIADNGTRIHVAVANACSQVISSTAMVNLLLDVVPPRLLRARGDASLERVIVTFSVGGCQGGPGLEFVSAQEPLNYSSSGGIVISNAQLDASGTNVVLTTGHQTPNALYTLRVEGVADWSGNTIMSGSEAMFQSWLVVPGPDPKVVPPPVSLFQSGPDIWITWPPGSFLQSANDIIGPWHTLLNPDFPYRVTRDRLAHFYRALFDP